MSEGLEKLEALGVLKQDRPQMVYAQRLADLLSSVQGDIDELADEQANAQQSEEAYLEEWRRLVAITIERFMDNYLHGRLADDD